MSAGAICGRVMRPTRDRTAGRPRASRATMGCAAAARGRRRSCGHVRYPACAPCSSPTPTTATPASSATTCAAAATRSPSCCASTPASGRHWTAPTSCCSSAASGACTGRRSPTRSTPRSPSSATPATRGIPVLAICFGSQLVAHALGGAVCRLEAAEIGWVDVDSDVPGIAGGPWLEWHGDVVRLPPGAVELAAQRGGPAGVAARADAVHAVPPGGHRDDARPLVRRWRGRGARRRRAHRRRS